MANAPFDLSPFIGDFINAARAWVAAQRVTHRPTAQSLPVGTFAGYFDAEIIDQVRWTWVSVIENPPFYAEIRPLLDAASVSPIDFTKMDAVTFVDTILLSRQRLGGGFGQRLMFHELVHVVQYEILGVNRFVELYVSGWDANGHEYEAIPLEVMAYDLDTRFDQVPSRPFSVRDEVTRRLRAR